MTKFPSFTAYFRAVTKSEAMPDGYEPLPWQHRMADHVLSHGRFPEAVSVETGLGKTTVMLIHLYALARDVHLNGPTGRTVPLRCFHAVERRQVVDQADAMARTVATAINGADDIDPVLGPVRTALQMLIPEPMQEFEPVVAVAALHGGRTPDYTWRRPVGAVLVTATVTQVTSRVLFRGVGVSQRMLPFDAALVGTDSVVFVDEPHLSGPAISALRQAKQVQHRARQDIGIPSGQVVLLGATTPEELINNPADVITTTADDLDHPVAGKKLRATKTLRLVKVPDHKSLLAAMADAATEAHRRDLGREAIGGCHGVLVFCNTVPDAQEVYTQLRKAVGDDAVQLVHGRMRAIDRATVPRARTITVTTQALEVGADLDGFEVVSQLPSLSALVQRIGRCNRFGDLDHAAVQVFAVADQLDPGTEAVYGQQAMALRDVLDTLTEGGTITLNVAPANMGEFRRQIIEHSAVSDNPLDAGRALVLDPLVRTACLRTEVARYASYTDPGTVFPTEAFLYGPDRKRELDVSVVWRADGTLDVLPLAPPSDLETVDMSLAALRRILKRYSTKRKVARFPVSDIDQGTPERANDSSGDDITVETLSLVRVRRTDASARARWVTPGSVHDITSGDLVVLDCRLGGYSDVGLDENCAMEVDDASERAVADAGFGSFVLLPERSEVHQQLHDALNDAVEAGNMDQSEWASIAAESSLLDELAVHSHDVTVSLVETDGNDTVQRRFIVQIGDTDFGDYSPRCSKVMSLRAHNWQVGHWTQHTTAVLPLVAQLANAVVQAGYRHDDGKADPRFQRYLNNYAIDGPARAKAPRVSETAVLRRRASSGLPDNWRHEAASANGVDHLLTRHVVVSHHAWGRPLILHRDCTEDPEPVLTGHVSVFDNLTEEYGPWGLALLETLMRWADHRASEHPVSETAVPADVPPAEVAKRELHAATSLYVSPGTGERTTIPLYGATASPMAGTLGAIALLARVHELLDPSAVIRWSSNGVPELNIDSEITETDVRNLRRDPKVWDAIYAAIVDILGVDGGLGVKNATLALRPSTIQDLPDDHPIWSVFTDTSPAGTANDGELVKFELLCFAFHNNSTPFAAACHPDLRDVTAESFFDPRAGYPSVKKKNGGVVKIKNGGVDVADLGDPCRAEMLAWAHDGYQLLGWSPIVKGVRGDIRRAGATITLPQPRRWVDLDGYRALLLSPKLAEIAHHRTWIRGVDQKSSQMAYWRLCESSSD